MSKDEFKAKLADKPYKVEYDDVKLMDFRNLCDDEIKEVVRLLSGIVKAREELKSLQEEYKQLDKKKYKLAEVATSIHDIDSLEGVGATAQDILKKIRKRSGSV